MGVRPNALVSDHQGQLGERVGEAGSWGTEVEEAPMEALNEGVLGNDTLIEDSKDSTLPSRP